MNLSNILIILFLSIIPSLIIFGIILYSDRKSSEPLPLILICAFSGILTTTLALFLQNFITNSLTTIYEYNNMYAYFGIKVFILSLVEEYCKLSILYLFISHMKSFDDIYDGFVYSAIIALSFAGIETIMYVFKEVTFYDMASLAIIRTFTSIPLHLACGIIMGYYIALTKFSKKKRYKIFELFKSISLPVLLHSCYNLTLTFLAENSVQNYIINITVVLFIVIIYIIGFIYIRKIISLNEMYVKNKKYPKKYNFLMHKPEYFKILKKKNKTK